MTRVKKSNKKSRRGPKPLDDAERVRNILWYCAVSSRGWTDYRLDLEFDETLARNADGSDRKRIFETIRKRRALPRRKRKERHLVTRVDQHREFRGTADYYESMFWQLVANKSMSVTELHRFAEKCMKRLGLVMLSLYHSLAYEASTLEVYGHKDDMLGNETTRRNYHGRETDLDSLALAGSLFKASYLAGDLFAAVDYRRIFLHLLVEFSAQEWMSPIAEEFRRFAKSRVLNEQSTPGAKHRASRYGTIVAADDPLALSIIKKEVTDFQA